MIVLEVWRDLQGLYTCQAYDTFRIEVTPFQILSIFILSYTVRLIKKPEMCVLILRNIISLN